MVSSADIHNLLFTFDLYRGMQENRLEYIYRGRFTDKVVENLLLLAESNLKKNDSNIAVRKRLYFLMVESLQNITRHQDEQTELASERSGIFIIRKTHNRYFVTTGNLIRTDEVQRLKQLIDSVNKLDADELRLYYRQVLDEGQISNKGGAGLGLIGMARKSGNKLEYSFKQLDEERAYFYLNISLEEQTALSTPAEEVMQYFENVAHIHNILNKENILLNYCGAFSDDIDLNIKEVVRSQIISSEEPEKLLEIIKEFARNVRNFGSDAKGINGQHTGILILSKVETFYRIATGNYIPNSEIQNFNMQINRCADLEKNKYQDSEYLRPEEDCSGFITILQESSFPVFVNIQPVDGTVSFVTVLAVCE